MREYTTNLGLVKPDKTDQYNVADFVGNMQKIDDFSGLTPPRALTADKLTVARNINGVAFDGTKNVITGLGLHSMTETYSSTNAVYDFDENNQLALFCSKQDGNQGHATTETDYWEKVPLGVSEEVLAQKANVDMDNLSTAGKEEVTSWGAPSDEYITLSLQADDYVYTVPADGFYHMQCGNGTSTQRTVYVKRKADGSETFTLAIYTPANAGAHGALSPQYKKGDKVRIGYNLSGSNKTFRFYYAKGAI